MFRSIRPLFVASVLTLSVVGTMTVGLHDASADVAGGAATTFFQGELSTIQGLLRKPTTPARDQSIDTELGKLIDFDAMAKRALGDEWANRSPAERQDFTDVLRKIVQKDYKTNLTKTLDYDIQYVGEEAQGGDTVVKTSATNTKDKRETPTSLDYVLSPRGSSFAVVDYVTEGSSATGSWHREVMKKLKKDGWDAVMKTMRAKL